MSTKKKIKFMPLTADEANEKCRIINNTLCTFCYYGNSNEACPPCVPYEREDGMYGYYFEVRTVTQKKHCERFDFKTSTREEAIKVVCDIFNKMPHDYQFSVRGTIFAYGPTIITND